MEKSISVVHIIIGLNRGGAELMLKRLVESQRELSSIQHTVISLTDLGVIGEHLVGQGVPVLCLGMSSFFSVPRTFFKLRKSLLVLRPDLVHTWMYHADLLGGLAARSAGFRNLVWCIRSTDIRMGGSKFTLLIRKICAWLSGLVPRVIVCAAVASRKAHEGVGYASRKMLVIPNGFEIKDLLAESTNVFSIRDELGITEDKKIVVSVGRYNPVKDHKTFIEAAGIIASTHTDVRFMLVGRGLDDSNPQLASALESSGHADAFDLMGERDDVAACLRASDIFCLHSITEGFPNALAEAMVEGLACITTDAGDSAYLLDNADWVVPAASPVRLADKLDQMLRLPSGERQALGKAAARRIREHFAMDVISRRYYDLYASLVFH